MNDECAFLLEGFDSPPMIMMPYNPRYYLDLMSQCGMAKAKDLYAFYMDATENVVKKIQGIVSEIKTKSNVSLRSISMKNIDDEVEKIKYVYNNGWEKNWGFVPWTENEMDHMGSFLLAIACERAEKAGVEAQPVLAHGKLLDSIVEVADDDAEIELIVLGRPAEESVYEPSSIRRLVDKIQEITGVTTRILP